MAISTILNSNNLGDTGELVAGTSFGGTVYYRKRNGIVNVYMANTQLAGLTANADNYLATLPNGYRPAKIYPMERLYSNNGFVYISNNGSIFIHTNSGITSGYMAFSILYVPND